MMAALAGAGTVLAAAGVLRAFLVALAVVWPFAPALVAPGALRAVPVVAALGADRILGIPVLAADETVAAVVLRAVVRSGDFEQTAGLADFPAAGVEWHALIVAAFLALAAFAIAGALMAVRAIRAVTVGAALRRGAPALFAGRARSCNVAVAVGAALSAVGAFRTVTAALLVIRAFRNDGAEVILADDAGAEGGIREDAVAGVAALSAFVPDAIAADATGAQIDALGAAVEALALLAAGAGILADAAVADFAAAAVAGVTALLAGAVAAVVAIASTVVDAEVGFAICLTGRPRALIRKRTVLENGCRRTGIALRASAVEARSGHGHRGCPAEQPLDRRAPRRARRERPGQGIELQFIHRPIVPFPVPTFSTRIRFFPHWKTR